MSLLDEKGLLRGLAALEGFIVPSTPPAASEDGRRSGSAGPSDPSSRSAATKQPKISALTVPMFEDGEQRSACTVTAQRPVNTLNLAAGPPQLQTLSAAATGPTLAFFLQIPPGSQQTLTAAVLPQLQPQPQPHQQHQVLRLSGCTLPSPPPDLPNTTTGCMGSVAASEAAACSSCDPRVLRKAVLLLTFNSPAATHAALARLHAVALASQGRAALAALQPVPLVARALATAVAAADHVGSERAAAVLLALLATAQLPLPEDVAAALIIPAAVQLLGGSGAAAAAAAAAVAAAVAAADASGTLSSTGLHVRLRSYVTGRAPPSSSVAAAAPMPQQQGQAASPISCRLAAARLLLHLATSPPSQGDSSSPLNSHLGPARGPSSGLGPGPGAVRDRMVSAGALEACCEAVTASVASAGASVAAAELQCRTLQLLAALTADVTGWPWQWPVVRAAAVDGCARHAVALLQLLDGGPDWAVTSGGGGIFVGSEQATIEAAAHAAARSVVVHLSRGPLLVREALVRAGALSPVVEAVMMWPPPAPPLPTQGAAGPLPLPSAGLVSQPLPSPPLVSQQAVTAGSSSSSSSSRLHFSLCLGVLLGLSSLPRVRATLASPSLGPLLAHLLGMLEQQPWESGAAGGGPLQQGEQLHLPAGWAVGCSAAAAGGPAEVRATLLELLLNLALDPHCHAGLAAQGADAMLVRCIAAGQKVRLEPGLTPRPAPARAGDAAAAAAASAQQPPRPQQQAYQQSWRAAAALRLVAALAADSRSSVARPAMQLALAAVGGVEVVAHEVTAAAAALGAGGGAAAAAAYDLAVAALCALMTGNGELQRRVAALPELLTALSAALPHPEVARSDGRLRLTLTAWRLITAPLATPEADPAVARSLLLGLGHNPDSLQRASGIIGGGIGSGGIRGGDAAASPLLCSRSRGLHDSSAARPASRQPRQSVLLTAAELRRRLSSASGDSLTLLDEPRRGIDYTSERGEGLVSELGRSDSPVGPAGALFSPARMGKGAAATVSAAAAGIGAPGGGGAAASQPLWTGPLLPGTPLPPPGAPPPSVAPLELPSCVVAASDSRPPSSVPGVGDGGLGRSLSRSRSRSRSRTDRPHSRDTESLGGSKPPAPPHRSAFVPADDDDDGGGADLQGLGLVRWSGSHRLAATPTSSAAPAVPLLPPPDDPAQPQSAVAPHLPGSLLPDIAEDGDAAAGPSAGRRASDTSSRRRHSSAGSERGKQRVQEGGAPRTPRGGGDAAAAGPRASSSNTDAGTHMGGSGTTPATTDTTSPSPRLVRCSSSASSSSMLAAASLADGMHARAAAGPSPEATATTASSSFRDSNTAAGAGAAGAAGPVPSLSSPILARPGGGGGDGGGGSATTEGAGTASVNPALEMAPPLLCLVTHLQALLGRGPGRPGSGLGVGPAAGPSPACRAIAALVLVQLARLEVVRRSAVMAAGWGALMQAVTSSLTAGLSADQDREWGGSKRESDDPQLLSGGASTASASGASAVLPTDPRDKLALLEVMVVAAGSIAGSVAAAEGRAALTAPPVISVLCDLACGWGGLAASLLRREDAVSQSGSGGGPLQLQQPADARRPFRGHQHQHHHYQHQQQHHSQGGDRSGGDPTQQQQQQQQQQLDAAQLLAQQQLQPYLAHARTLAMEILGRLLNEGRVAAQLQEGRAGALLAEQQLQALAAAAEAAEAVASSSSSVSSHPAYSDHRGSAGPAGGSLLAEAAQRQRNAAARLLLRLGAHVGCAREALTRPVSVTALIEMLSWLWDAHASALVPAFSSLLPRTGLPSVGSYTSLGLSRVSRPGGGTTGLATAATAASAAAMESTGGASAATSDSNLNVTLANRRSSNLQADSHKRLAAGAPPMPSSTSPPLPLLSPTVSDGPLMRRSVTAGSRAMSGQLQLQRPQTPMLGATRSGGLGGGFGGGGAGVHPGMAPHGVPTRMSLHASVCTETAQWTSPAQHAMKALEMSEERQQAPPASGPALPYHRHAHTHTGSLMVARPSPLSAGSRPGQRGGGSDGDGGDGGGDDSDGLASRDDSLTMLAPPPKKPPSAPPDAARQPLLPPPPPPLAARLRGGASGLRGGRIAEVAFAADVNGGGGGPTEDGGAGGEGDGGSGAEDHDGHGLVAPNIVLRRGTRALAPPVAPGAGLHAVAAAVPRTAAATSAAQCASDIVQLLQLLAEGDVDAARAMATLPAVELFVDLLASSSAPLVLSTLGLLERLAERQDAHETFWDCDAVAQLVAHLQLRSAAGAAAAAAAAATDASAVAVASATAVQLQLQLGAARVLERLCGDPDLHGRLAATELSAALMAVVKRCADPDPDPDPGAQQQQVCSASSASRAPRGTSLLSCALSALASLLDCADVRRQARERRFPLQLGILAGGGGCADPLVAHLAARCGEKLREEPPRIRAPPGGDSTASGASGAPTVAGAAGGSGSCSRPPLAGSASRLL